MIQRINLIEKQAFAFTYETLMRICLVIVALNVLVVGSQYLRSMRLKPQIDEAKARLEQLNKENASLTKQPVIKKKKTVSIGQYQYLFDTLESIPNWSDVMRVLSNNLPNAVWISNFKSLGKAIPPKPPKGEDEDEDEDEKKKAPPPPVNLPMRIEITGVSTDIRAIAEFSSNLEKAHHFSKMVLTNTTKDGDRYAFTLQGQVSASESEDAR